MITRRDSVLFRSGALLVLCCFVTGCVFVHPEQFATAGQVYSERIDSDSSSPPADSVKRTTLQAPFADVFVAAKNAATMALLTIEASEEDAGLILLSRVVPDSNPSEHSNEKRFFYAVTFEEAGPETTDVAVYAKVQEACTVWGPGMYVLGILSLVGILFIPMWAVDSSTCANELSVPHWAVGQNNSLQEMNNLLNFTRNNLIAAGAL